MIRPAALLVLAGVLAAALPSAAAPAGLFPDEVVAAGGGSSNRLELKPLWTPGALSAFRQRLRVTIEGISTTSVSVELDQSVRGQWSGLLRERADGALLDDGHFGISEASARELAELIERARLWTTFPQFFQASPDAGVVCLDGEGVIFERRDASGYRYAEGNAPCTLGSAQIDVAAKMLQLARRPELVRLLR